MRLKLINTVFGLNFLTRTIVFMVAALLASPVYARAVALYSYEQYADRATMIVIATVVEKTKDTFELTTLPGVTLQKGSGKQTPFEVVGTETRFKITLHLKGGEGLSEFTLHHYRAKDSDCIMGCIGFRSFEPEIQKGNTTFLMFLTREADGRFAPALDAVDITKSINRIIPDITPPPTPPKLP